MTNRDRLSESQRRAVELWQAESSYYDELAAALRDVADRWAESDKHVAELYNHAAEHLDEQAEGFAEMAKAARSHFLAIHGGPESR